MESTTLKTLSVSSTEISLLSIDPGFRNLGWSICSWRGGGLFSVKEYDVFRFSDVSPTTSEVSEGLQSFFSEVMFVYRDLYDGVLIEEQPFIMQKNNTDELRMMNFRLQQIDMGIRGLAIGLRKNLYTVTPKSVRLYLKTCTGDYNSNKREHVLYCKARGLDFKDLPPMMRCHVADTVCNVFYYLSKNRGLRLHDLDQSQQYHRAFSKGRQERHALAQRQSSPPSSEGSGTSSSQEDDSPD